MFKKYFSLFSIIFMIFCLASYAAEVQTDNIIATNNTNVQNKELDPKNTLYIELKDGIVIAELFPNVAPMHVQRIRTLTGDGFYDNIKFHRVINGFMAQTGDPTGTGRGGSRLGKLYAEFNNEHHTRGTLSMARASDPNSANSQFFIVTGDFFPQLDNQYTVFGRVIDGMEYVDKIKAGDTANNGAVENPDVMIKVITGDMLNNKSVNTVKEEIKIINDMQAQKLREDPNYKKKSVLELLLSTKDIDINEVEEQPVSTPQNKDNKDVQNDTSAIKNSQVSEPATQVSPKPLEQTQPNAINPNIETSQPVQDSVEQQKQPQTSQTGTKQDSKPGKINGQPAGEQPKNDIDNLNSDLDAILNPYGADK